MRADEGARASATAVAEPTVSRREVSRLRARPPSRPLTAALLACLVAFPSLAFGDSSPSTDAVPLSNPDYPLGSWKMFHANPEHTGETDATLPPLGHVVWSFLNNTFDKPEGGAVVDNGVVYVGLGRDLTARNVTGGGAVWARQTSGRILSTPALWNGTVFVGSEASAGRPNMYAFDAATGALRWQANETPADLGGGIHFVHSSPAVVDGVVYYGSLTYWLYARDASNGSLLWSANLTSEATASPAVSNGIVYAASAGIHNLLTPTWDVPPMLWAFNATTGGEVWNRTVTEGHLRASPVVSAGVVYLATAGFSYLAADVDAGYILALDAASGTPLWTSPDVGRMEATPAVYGSLMYVATAGQQAGGLTGTDARLRALDLSANGTEVWNRVVGDNAAMLSSPAAVGGRIVAAARDGTVAVFLNSGGQVWSYTLPDEVTAPVAVASEMVFVPALDGALYAFGAQPQLSVGGGDIALSDGTPHAGEPLTLSVTVHNRGDKLGSSDVEASVDFGGAATAVASWTVTGVPIINGQVTVQAPLRFAQAGLANLTVSLVNVTPQDGNLSDNSANATVEVLPRLDGWLSRYADAHGSNFLETDSPQNNILLWKQDVFDVQGAAFLAFGSRLILVNNATHTLYALARDNGSAVAWSWTAPAAVVGTPAIASGVLVVATCDPGATAGNLTFLEPDAGAVLSTVPLAGVPTTSLVPYGDLLLLGMSDRLLEVNVSDPSALRELPTVDVAPLDQPALQSEPVVVSGWAFAVSSVGELHAFNLTTLTEPAGWPVQLRGRTDVPPVVGGGFLFVVNGPTNVSAFSLAPLDPAPAWNTTLDGPIEGPMASAYGRLFVATQGNLSALIAGSGLLDWIRSLEPAQPSNGVRAVGNSTVFTGSERLFAVSAGTGIVDWVYEPGLLGPLVGGAALYGGTLHLASASGAILTLGLRPGRPPTACIASPPVGQTHRTREAVNFSSSCTTDPDNQNLTFLWDLGDGSTASTPEVNHTFAFPGDFRVKLTVTDELGLASLKVLDIHVIDNTAPFLVAPVDNLRPVPDVNTFDTTLWRFKVLYSDPDGDPPTEVFLNITNELEPLKPMAIVGLGPYDFQAGVEYEWLGQLLSATHNYTFSASDGLDTAQTGVVASFSVFRIENRSAPPVSFLVQYVGQGSSLLRDVTGIAGPAGLGVLHRFSVTLPANATLPQWIRIEFRYDLAVNVSDYVESSIRAYTFDGELPWNAALSIVDEAAHTVVAKLSRSAFTAGPEGLIATFGIFGELKVPPQPPIAVADVVDSRPVYAPGDRIAFSGARSQERNDNNLSNLTFTWEFGDGSPTATGMFVNHSFNRSDIFSVRLTVTNSFGQSHSTTVSVTVRTEASESTFLGLAALLIGALFLLFVLWPVFMRRGGGAGPRPLPPRRKEQEGASSKSAKVAQVAAPRKNAPSPAAESEDAEVLDELQGEFEKDTERASEK